MTAPSAAPASPPTTCARLKMQVLTRSHRGAPGQNDDAQRAAQAEPGEPARSS